METPVHVLCAIKRLVAIARADTEESEAVASFLLAWAESPGHEGFSIQCLRSLNTSVRNDVRAVMNLLFDFGFPSPTNIGVEHHIRQIAAFPGEEIVWKVLEKRLCAKGPLTADQQGHIIVLSSIYREGGHSEAAIQQRLAAMTTAEITDAVYQHIGFGHMSEEECDEHIAYLLKRNTGIEPQSV
jgi:hypothetical protein